MAAFRRVEDQAHPQPSDVEDLWGDGVAGFSHLFLAWIVVCAIAEALWPDLRAGLGLAVLGAPLTLCAGGMGMCFFMLTKLGSDRSGWPVVPTIGAYLVGLAAAVVVSGMLWISTWTFA